MTTESKRGSENMRSEVEGMMSDTSDFYARASKMWSEGLNSWAKMGQGQAPAAGKMDMENLFKPYMEKMQEWGRMMGSTSKNMAGGMPSAEVFTKASEMWTDSLKTWAKMAQSQAFTPGKMDMESLFKPYWNNMQEMGRMLGNSSSSMTGMFPALASMKDNEESLLKAYNAYLKIYDTFFRNFSVVVREGYEVAREISAKEEPDIDKYMDAVRTTYTSVNAAAVEALKDTPLAGIKEVNAVLNQTLDTTPEQRLAARSFLLGMYNSGVKASDLAAVTLKKIGEATTKLGKGAISSNAYDKAIEEYTKSLKHTYDSIQLPEGTRPEYKILMEDTLAWVKADLELYYSWLETDLAAFQGVNKSLAEVSKTGAEVYGSGKTLTAEELNKGLTQAFSKSMDTMIKGPQYFENASKLVQAYNKWQNAANKVSATLMTSPYPTKEQLEEVLQGVEKLRKSSEVHSKAAQSEVHAKAAQSEVHAKAAQSRAKSADQRASAD